MIRYAHTLGLRPFLIVWMLCLSANSSVTAEAAPERRSAPEGKVFALVKDGRARARVVVQAQASHRLERGVADLVKYIEKISGARLERASAASAGRGAVVRVRQIQRLADLPKDGFVLVIGRGGITIEAWGEEGLHNGLIELLDRQGVRWYWPGESGRYVPRRKTIEYRHGRENVVPDYLCRAGIGGGQSFDENWNRLVGEWARRNRYGGWQRHGSGHSYHFLVPAKAHFAAHPEYFALVKGKRNPGNLCVSNPAVVRLATQMALTWLEGHEREMVCISPPDGALKCECKNCTCLDVPGRGRSDRVVWFANQVMRGVGKKFPRVKGVFYHYADYQYPPARERPDANVMGWFTLWYSTGFRQDYPMSAPQNARAQKVFLDNAALFQPGAIYAYYGHYRWITFWPQVENMIRDFPWWHRHGARVFYSQTHQSWGTQHANYFWMARMGWNIKTDVAAEKNCYYNRFLGPAGPAMREMDAVILQAFRSRGPVHGEKFADAQRYRPEMLARCRALMGRAKKACGTQGAGNVYAYGLARQPELRQRSARAFRDLYELVSQPANAGLVSIPPRKKGIDFLKIIKELLDRIEKPGTRFARGSFGYSDMLSGGGKALFDAKTIRGFKVRRYGYGLSPGGSGVLEWKFDAIDGAFHTAVLGLNDPVKRKPGKVAVSVSVDGGKTFAPLDFSRSKEMSRKGKCRMLPITQFVKGSTSFLVRVEATNQRKRDFLVLDSMRLHGEIR